MEYKTYRFTSETTGEECEVKIADANEGKSLEVSLITESSTATVSLEKR